MYCKSKAYTTFTIINIIFIGAVGILCILPLINVLAVSLSAKHAADAGLVNLVPIDFTLDAYKETLNNVNFLNAIGISVIRTIIGTSIQLILLFLAAYPLSLDDRTFKGRNFFAWYFVFTMLFSAGLIPWFLTVNSLGLTNTIWALVLPGAVPVFSLVLMINFFRGIPSELREAALIDGAGHIRVLFRIYLPISLPSIATIGLMSIVGHWNSWFDGMILISDYTKYPLATFLQTVVVAMDFTKMNIDPSELVNLSTRTLKAAQVFIASIPVLMVYPFLQRYFIKGMTLGSVKE